MKLSTHSVLAVFALFTFGFAASLVAQGGHTHAVPQDPCFGPCEDAVGITEGCGGGGGSSQNYGDQMILLHSGQERRRQVDMRIEGRDHAVPFVVERKHLTRVDQVDSIFGPAWAFNYDHTFTREVSGNDLIFVGFGRTDTFGATKFDGGGEPIEWEGKSGRLDWAIHDTAVSGQLKVRRPGGTTMIFDVVLSGGNISSGYLVEVQSPNGNNIKIEYEDAKESTWLKNNKQRPDYIVDSFGRTIDFVYGHTQTSGIGAYPDLVTSIVDMDLRTVVYDYTNDHLITVRSPIVSTSTVNDFLSGKTRMYHYRGITTPSVDPLLKYALESEIFPNQFVSSSIPVLNGPARLRWTYDESGTPGSNVQFGWVTEHYIGDDTLAAGLKAGGKFTYSYEDKYTAPGINKENIRTTVTDRRAVVSILRFNALGQMLREEIVRKTSLRPAQTPALGNFIREFHYKEDGNDDGILDWSKTPLQVAGMVSAERTDIGFSTVSGIPRLSAGSQTSVVTTPDGRGYEGPDGTIGTSDDTIGTSTVYEPVFNRPFKVTDERGFDTIYRYDYMENLSASVPLLAPKIGLTTTELNTLLGNLGILNQGEINGDSTTAQYCGNVIKIEHPDVTLPSQATATIIGLPATQTATEIFWYNEYGQEIRHEDEEENVHLKTYFSSKDPDGDTTNDVPAGTSTTTGGYLATVKIDTDSASTRNSGSGAAAVNKLIEYEYTSQTGAFGTYPANKRGIPTKVKNPRLIEDIYLINELNQVVVKERDKAVSGFSYWTKTLRDENDNVVERQVQNIDTLPGAPANDYVSTAWAYNILDLVELKTEDAGGLGINTSYEYDKSTNLEETVNGSGLGSSASSKTTRLHDERNIVYSTTRGAGTVDSKTTNKIDANGNITVEIDAEGDHETEFAFDGHDRVKTVTDRLDYTRDLVVDAAGNVTTEKISGKIDTLAAASNFLQSQTDYHFDARNRMDREDKHIFHYTGFSVGTIDDGALDNGDDKVSTEFICDRKGRTTWVVDADKNYTETKWDGADRKHSVINWRASPSAKEYNIRDFEYDDNDNLTKVTDTEKNVNNLITGTEAFVTEFEYDALDRRSKMIEPGTAPNRQETVYEYDSRNNLIVTTDELGNEVERYVDKLNRLLETRTWLSSTGTGANSGPGNHDTSQSGDGRITIAQSYDELHRMVTATDDKLNVTTVTYDDLSRKTRVDYADLTFETWTYNDDSELLTHTTQNNSVETWTHDVEGRPTKVLVNNGATTSTVVGSTHREWGYDALDRPWITLDQNGPLSSDDVLVIKWRDSLGRLIRENMRIGPFSPLSDRIVTCEYQGANRLVKDKYPSGLTVTRTYDEMDRLKEVSDAGGSIAKFDYAGARRVVKRTYGNGAVNNEIDGTTLKSTSGTFAGFDSRGRSIRHEWQDSLNAQITCYTNKYNGPGEVGTNRRCEEKRKHLGGRKDKYIFDSAYRMTDFQPNYQAPSTRDLDGADKMTKYLDLGVAKLPVVDASPGGLNQYASFAGVARTYDKNGALTKIANTVPIDYEYDSQDRLVHIKLTVPGPPVTTYVSSLYVYDADGRRVAVCVPVVGPAAFTWRRDCWRGNQVIEESDLFSTAIYREYVDGMGIDEHLRMTDHTPLVGGPKDYYYHCNSQGSVGAMTDINEVVVETYEYGWFGFPTVTPAVAGVFTGNPYMFQGRRADSDSGLYYFRTRYYDSVKGDFTTIDPSDRVLGASSPNLVGMWRHGQGNGYSAFSEDPWNWLDPLGLTPEDPSRMSTRQFIVWYYGANGQTYDIVAMGQLAHLQEMLKKDTNKIKSRLGSIASSGARKACSKPGNRNKEAVDFLIKSRGNRTTVDLEGQLYWLGRGTLFWGIEGSGIANCCRRTFTASGNWHFSFRDRGEEPFINGGPDAPLSVPYDIEADWSEPFHIMTSEESF